MSDQSYTLTGNLLVWGLISGTLLSYLPQYIKIYNSKSTKGISETTIIFGIYSCMFNTIGTVQEDYKNIYNCHTNNNCYNTIIPIIQLTAPGLCIITLYLFYIYFSKNPEDRIILNSSIKFKYKFILKRAKFHFVINSILIISAILNIINSNYNTIKNVGKIYNLISVVFSLIMWLPQIYTTFILKTDYSLSLLALSIHSFGCFITVFYQYFIAHQSILVILNYIVGGICEAIIVFIVYYYRKIKVNTFPPAYNNLDYTTL